MIATTTDCEKLQYRSPKRLYCCFRLSIVVAIDRVSFFAVGVVENPRLATGMSVTSVILSGIEVLPVCIATLLFRVIRQCRIYLWTLSLSLAWSITLFTAL